MPAKLYGQLAGGPVQALRSGLIGIVPPFCKDSSDLVLSRDYVVTNGNVIGDQVSLGTFMSTTFLDTLSSYLMSDAMGVGAACNVGDVLHPAALASGFGLTSSAAWRALGSVAALIAAPLWQRLGYAADPGGQIELLATFAGANPLSGTGFAWHLVGRM